jgi:host factor-I protein
MTMDTDNALSVQNAFFNQVRKDKTKVSVLLNNGQRIAGIIKSFDKFTFLLDTRHGEQMIFKHAVSAVSLFKQEGSRPHPHPAEPGGGEDAPPGGDAPAAEGGPAADRSRRAGKQETRFGNFIRFDDAQGTGKS